MAIIQEEQEPDEDENEEEPQPEAQQRDEASLPIKKKILSKRRQLLQKKKGTTHFIKH